MEFAKKEMCLKKKWIKCNSKTSIFRWRKMRHNTVAKKKKAIKKTNIYIDQREQNNYNAIATTTSKRWIQLIVLLYAEGFKNLDCINLLLRLLICSQADSPSNLLPLTHLHKSNTFILLKLK